MPLFQRFGVEDQLTAMYHPVVQLKSGGYLVINPTEALVSIDINSGRSTREHNIEQTATATNLEAAHEIARQLRLRDMAGLVVIDFIDMENGSNVRKVEKAMKEALKNDRARIQVGRISSFGLMEMSRQRLRTGVLEASTRICPHCEGTGFVRTASSAGLSALRLLEEAAARGRGTQLTLRASREATIYVLNRKRAEIMRDRGALRRRDRGDARSSRRGRAHDGGHFRSAAGAHAQAGAAADRLSPRTTSSTRPRRKRRSSRPRRRRRRLPSVRPSAPRKARASVTAPAVAAAAVAVVVVARMASRPTVRPSMAPRMRPMRRPKAKVLPPRRAGEIAEPSDAAAAREGSRRRRRGRRGGRRREGGEALIVDAGDVGPAATDVADVEPEVLSEAEPIEATPVSALAPEAEAAAPKPRARRRPRARAADEVVAEADCLGACRAGRRSQPRRRRPPSVAAHRARRPMRRWKPSSRSTSEPVAEEAAPAKPRRAPRKTAATTKAAAAKPASTRQGRQGTCRRGRGRGGARPGARARQ